MAKEYFTDRQLRDFQHWEDQFKDVQKLDVTDSDMEQIFAQKLDPIACAIALQNAILEKHPGSREAQVANAQIAVNELSYHYTATSLNNPAQIDIDQWFTPIDQAVSHDMQGVINVIKKHDHVRVGGKLGFFEKHYFEDLTSPIGHRALISVRLHSAAYRDPSLGEENSLVRHDNYLTIPVTAIGDYYMPSPEEIDEYKQLREEE